MSSLVCRIVMKHELTCLNITMTAKEWDAVVTRPAYSTDCYIAPMHISTSNRECVFYGERRGDEHRAALRLPLHYSAGRFKIPNREQWTPSIEPMSLLFSPPNNYVKSRLKACTFSLGLKLYGVGSV